jgi:hypothetical protein
MRSSWKKSEKARSTAASLVGFLDPIATVIYLA